MKLRKMAAAWVFALALVLTLPALAADGRVFDRADLLSASQEAALEAQIEGFQQETGMDFVIVTSDEAHDGKSQQQIADAFYDQGGFGLDENDNYIERESLHLPEGYIKGSVGAGDAFCAGVLCGAEHGQCLGDAIELGIASAAASLSEANATDGVRSIEETRKLYRELR